ncbi:MAG: DUF2330 domain-containing protein [Verrucomicrobiales bacterium]|nr:DUF2330 domain-containing protein [Verrucomicrobiales bacterium]
MRFLVLVCLYVWAGDARGDGKLFPPVGFTRAETPSQRALIHWADGLETLVVETTVRSQATNLAWILPLPSPPTSIRAVDPGLFPTLQTTFQARVEFSRSKAWIGGLVVAAFVLLWRWHQHGKLSIRLWDCLLVLVVLVFLSAMLLPALGKAKAGGQGPSVGSTVRLLGSVRAGVMDLATITAERPEDLIDWLHQRGFATPDAMTPVVRDYLAKGWVFVAAKVVAPEPNTLAALHPVAFTFPARSPVYPMRLTGIGGAPLTCDLYVFGPSRAKAQGWSVRYCSRPIYTPATNAMTAPDGLRIRHPELARLVAQSPVATKLSRTLVGSAFDHDIELAWESYRPAGQRAYTEPAAQSRAVSAGAAVLAVGLLLGRRAHHFRGLPIPWFHRHDRNALVAACLAGVIAYGCLPRVELDAVKTLRRYPVNYARNQLQQWALEAADTDPIQQVLHAAQPVSNQDWERARDELSTLLATLHYPIAWKMENWTLTNLFSSTRLRLESSPGNLTLERTAQGLELVWHDFDGYPALRCVVPKFDPPAPTDSNTKSR